MTDLIVNLLWLAGIVASFYPMYESLAGRLSWKDEPDGSDRAFAAFLAALGAVFWPVTGLAFGAFHLSRLFTQWRRRAS